MGERGGWGVRDGHALLSIYRVEFLGDKCESMFRDNLFPSASPYFSLASLLALPPTFPFPMRTATSLIQWEG